MLAARRWSGLTLVAVAALGLSAGCRHLGEHRAQDTVSGYYEGDWYGPNPDRPLGELTCTITPAGPDAWDALFFATFGGFGEYEVGLEGHREGERVVFGGSVDLGETSGGVFNWDGEIVGDEFNGTYTSQGINGSFRMERAPAPDDK